MRGDGYFLAIELVPDKATRGVFTAEQAEWLIRGYLSPRLYDLGLNLLAPVQLKGSRGDEDDDRQRRRLR